MNQRRNFLAAAGALAASSFTSAGAQGTKAGAASAQACTTFDRTRQANTTPDAALAMLKEGNARFVAGKSINCDLLAQAKATAEGQAPFASVVGCIDSRVPPELVFDQRIGDIFTARVAGNFVNTDIIGSLEFATKLSGSKLIVVLGHSECGAIKGAVDDAKLGNLTAMLANIRPAVLKIKGVDGPQSSKNKKLVQAVADVNAKDAAATLVSKSEVLRELVKEGQLKIVAAMYDLATGRVTWL
uniref:carbonic anhydrase n=1 Tax=uncultured bacterium 888 TaxID=548896 RepID=B8R8Q9_9BACT|nr:putative carbonic anhydrase [uncultured bacterium 888]